MNAYIQYMTGKCSTDQWTSRTRIRKHRFTCWLARPVVPRKLTPSFPSQVSGVPSAFPIMASPSSMFSTRRTFAYDNDLRIRLDLITIIKENIQIIIFILLFNRTEKSSMPSLSSRRNMGQRLGFNLMFQLMPLN